MSQSDSWHDLNRVEGRSVVLVRIDGETFRSTPVDEDRAEALADEIHRLPSSNVSDASVLPVTGGLSR